MVPFPNHAGSVRFFIDFAFNFRTLISASGFPVGKGARYLFCYPVTVSRTGKSG